MTQKFLLEKSLKLLREMKTYVQQKEFVHSSSIHNNCILEATQVSISGGMDKQIVVDSYGGILHGNKKVLIAETWNNMDVLPEHHAERKKPHSKMIPSIWNFQREKIHIQW